MTTPRPTAEPTPAPDHRPGHRRRRELVVAVVGLLAIAALVPAAWLGFENIAEPDGPSAFYTPPATLPAGGPGTLIRSQVLTPLKSGATVTRVLYTSTDAEGTAIAVSGVAAVPPGEPPAGGWPVVAWAHGTSGVASRCAPTIDFGLGGLERVPGLDQLLAGGVVVVATDYPGLGTPGPHPYLVGESEGRSTLDSIRAASGLTGGHTSKVSAIYGHSQGGHATLFAAALAPSYAPELDVVGAAPMSPPTDLGVLLERDAEEPAGVLLTALAISSWSRLYPEANEDAVVHEAAKPYVASLGRDCIGDNEETIAALPDVVALLTEFLSAEPSATPGWSELLEQNSPPAKAQAVPLLVSQGLADPLVRPDVTEDYVTQQCKAGADIELDTYATAGHLSLRTEAADKVVDWLLERVAGVAAPTGCSTRPLP